VGGPPPDFRQTAVTRTSVVIMSLSSFCAGRPGRALVLPGSLFRRHALQRRGRLNFFCCCSCQGRNKPVAGGGRHPPRPA